MSELTLRERRKTRSIFRYSNPAAFARWADRAGHEIVDVARIRDVKGKQAVRLLLRKDTGLLAGPAPQA